MESTQRDVIFISHANPEDNAFTAWLGSRLSDLGFKVWADILNLRAGQDWQRLLENAIRDRATKVLVVGSQTGLDKQGVRNEIQIANDVAKKIGDKNFLIPLRLEQYEAPFSLVHIQYIDFSKSWALGLANLCDTLENEYKVSRDFGKSSYLAKLWQDTFVSRSSQVESKSETLISNWLKIESFPKFLFYYECQDLFIDRQTLDASITSMTYPNVKYKSGILTFSSFSDVNTSRSPQIGWKLVSKIATSKFQLDGWHSQKIRRGDARRFLMNLTRQALELMLSGKHMTSYVFANEQLGWWFDIDACPESYVKYNWGESISGKRKLIGSSRKKGNHWHYGVTLRPSLFPIPHVKLIHRVIFTVDGKTPITSLPRMHRMRRSFTKSWRNDRWRDMQHAFLYFISGGYDHMSVRTASDSYIRLRLPAMQINSPFSVDENIDVAAFPLEEVEVDLDEVFNSEEFQDGEDFDDLYF
ncbi:MAG: toll/interleukin-1 receptor domain-containing protein [Gammaproteobacteria bacterium]|nr:toll/interleukin-1 receptor domain-containing protein [Gammaproteobacteria bacterium]